MSQPTPEEIKKMIHTIKVVGREVEKLLNEKAPNPQERVTIAVTLLVSYYMQGCFKGNKEGYAQFVKEHILSGIDIFSKDTEFMEKNNKDTMEW